MCTRYYLESSSLKLSELFQNVKNTKLADTFIRRVGRFLINTLIRKAFSRKQCLSISRRLLLVGWPGPQSPGTSFHSELFITKSDAISLNSDCYALRTLVICLKTKKRETSPDNSDEISLMFNVSVLSFLFFLPDVPLPRSEENGRCCISQSVDLSFRCVPADIRHRSVSFH